MSEQKPIIEDIDASLPSLPPRDETGKFTKVKNEATEPTPEVEPKTTHSPSLVAAALDVGLEPADIDSMSPATLSRIVRSMLIQRSNQREQDTTARTLQRTPQAQPVAEEPEEDFSLGANEEAFDPDMVRAIKAGIIGNRKELRKLQKELEAQRQRHEAQRSQEMVEAIDDAFEQLGEEYHQIVGKGSAYDLQETDKAAMRRRVAIIEHANVANVNSRRALGAKIRAAAEELFGFSLKKEAPKKQEAPQRKIDPYGGVKPRFSKDEWDQAGTAHPTHRATFEEPPGPDKAIRGLSAKLGEAARTAEDQDTLNGLL